MENMIFVLGQSFGHYKCQEVIKSVLLILNKWLEQVWKCIITGPTKLEFRLVSRSRKYVYSLCFNDFWPKMMKFPRYCSCVARSYLLRKKRLVWNCFKCKTKAKIMTWCNQNQTKFFSRQGDYSSNYSRHICWCVGLPSLTNFWKEFARIKIVIE